MTEKENFERIKCLSVISGMLTSLLWLEENEMRHAVLENVVDRIDCLIQRTLEERERIIERNSEHEKSDQENQLVAFLEQDQENISARLKKAESDLSTLIKWDSKD